VSVETWTGFVAVVAFVFGLVFGSFANVVIWRLPRGESLSHPGSHCPGCGHPIRWYDNVPVLGWVALKGRCRDCGEAISWRYPSVELASGLLFLFAFVAFGFTLRALSAIFMYYMLLLLSAIDLDTRRLPNPLVLILGLGGLLLCLIAQFTGYDPVPLVAGGGAFGSPLVAAFTGAVTAGGLTLLISVLYGSVRGRAGLGMGDVKLLVALSPFLGVYTVGVFFAGTVFGTLWGVVAASRSGSGGGTKFAFGPCLALAAVLLSVWGGQLWMWYAGLVGLA